MNDRARGAVSVTPVSELSLRQRLVIGARVLLRQDMPEWFSPREPLPPVAPPDVKGRAFDYQTGFNLNIQPRHNEPVSFQQMRTLADQYDLMRLVIETRKDQIAKLKWNIRPRDKDKPEDARSKKLEELFQSPDGEHDWDGWCRALVEEMLVIDAASVYPVRNGRGELMHFELIDGATIKRVIGYDGRTPDEGPAYQQVLKGMPAVDFTKDELVYRPRNWRVHKVYGYSPVEQVIMTVNIALRRQLSQLAYYTEGNVPESLIGVPTNWTTQQIKEFQTYWDSLIAGDMAQRRRARFVPGDMKYQPTREPIIKDMYDEWLARIVCFAFSISPQPFVAMMNRATAESAQEAALEEGLAPIMNWIKSLVDYLLRKYLGAADLEFVWDDEVRLDKKTAADVHSIYLDRKVLTPDEVREEIGKEPMTPEEREKAWPEPVMEPGGPPGKGKPPKGDEEGDDEEKGAYLGDLAKRGAPRPKAKSPAPINRERRAAKRAERLIRAATEKALDAVAEEVTDFIGLNRVNPTAKADSELLRALDRLRYAGLDVLVTDMEEIFTDLVRDGGMAALVQVGVGLDDRRIVDLVNEQAVAWARTHAAELVGKKWVDGVLVDNPNAKWRIDKVTRKAVRDLVVKAEDEGWSNDRLAKAIREDAAFSRERAMLVARTETARADVAGNMIAYQESGVVKGKRWLQTRDIRCCDSCADNAKQGVIPFKKAFQSGDMQAPAHPNCRCDVLPVLDNEVAE